MAKFCGQHEFGPAYSLLSLDRAAVVPLLAVHTPVAATNTLLCLVVPGLEDSESR